MNLAEKRQLKATRRAKMLFEFLQSTSRPAIKNFAKVAKVFGVHHQYGTTLQDMGLLVKVEGDYKWLGGKITTELVEEVKSNVNKQTNQVFYS